MKNPSVRDWLIDFVVVVCLPAVAVFLLPLFTAWFTPTSLRFGQIAFFAVGQLLPHTVIGCSLGVVAARLIRHRTVYVALLPSVLVCGFYVLYLSFGPIAYHWAQSRYDFVLIASWLLLVTASFLCARFILRRRQPNHSLQPTATRFAAGGG